MRYLVYALVAAAFLVVLSLRAGLVFTWYYDLGGVEQDEIYTLQRALAGYPVYENPEQPPFSITQKTPLYHYLCLGIGKMSGVNPDYPFQVYVLSRCVSLILCLLTLGLAFFFQRRWLGTPVAEALMACMLIFLCLEEHAFDRPDSLYTFLFLTTLSIATAAIHGQQKQLWLWASGLAAMTIFAKQSGILLPALLLGHLAWQREWKLAFRCGLVFAFTFVVLLWVVSGESLLIFKANVVDGVRNGIVPGWVFDFIYNRSYKKFAIPIAVGLFMAGEWLLRRQAPGMMRWLGLCLAGTLGFAHITGLKWGSTPSYFTEFNILVWMSVFYYWRQELLPQGPGKIGDRIRYLARAFALVMIPLQTSDKNLLAPYNLADKQLFEQSEQLRAHLALRPDDYVLVDHPVPKLYLFRHALVPQNDIVLSLMAFGVYEYPALQTMLETGKIRYFITREDHIDENAILEGRINFAPFFRYDHSFNGFHLYVPTR